MAPEASPSTMVEIQVKVQTLATEMTMLRAWCKSLSDRSSNYKTSIALLKDDIEDLKRLSESNQEALAKLDKQYTKMVAFIGAIVFLASASGNEFSKYISKFVSSIGQ